MASTLDDRREADKADLASSKCTSCHRRHQPGRCERQMQPRWLTGDLVIKEPLTALREGWSGRRGIVIGVRRSNGGDRLPEAVYPYVYYVFFQDEKFEGPLFQSELHDA